MIPDKIKAVAKSDPTCDFNSYFPKEIPPLKIWEQSNPATADHPYLRTKKIKPYEIRQSDNELIIPMYDCNHKLQNLQRIFPDGKKLFLPEKPTKGCFYILGIPKPSGKIYIAEGYATAASIHEATEQCTVVAFSANNLPAVAETIKWEYPDTEIIICADNDIYNNDKNIGLDKASEAAMIIDAKLVIPKFKDLSSKPKDFNDLAVLEGANEVRIQLDGAKKFADISEENQDEAINRLAKLSLLEYGRIRKEEAAKLNVTVGILDTAVKVVRQLNSQTKDSTNELEAGIKPCDQSVEGHEVASKIQDLIKKHIILSEHQTTILTLWVFGSYCINAFGIFPKLLITSPDKRCGKTTVLSVLRSIVNKALVASNVTPSAMFRSIELWLPTLLIDEGDTFINNDNEDLRGIINSGHTRDTAYVLRTEGDSSNRRPKQFSTWTPMAIAMIKNPPDTILDRSLVIKLRRKLASERVTKWSLDNFSKLTSLRQQLRRWSDDNLELLKNCIPNMPSNDNDRASDNWLPLFSIASLISAKWRIRLEEAFKSSNGNNDEDNENISTLLLIDIKKIFAEINTDKIHSSDLVAKLIGLEDRPWSEYRHGKQITTNTLARLLSSFGIKPKQVYIAQNKQGYYLSDFDDTFSRYIPVVTC
ncbi:MAG: DUF3631 domain-containing protein [bacterium]